MWLKQIVQMHEVTLRCNEARMRSTRTTSLKSIISLATFVSRAALSFSASTAGQMIQVTESKYKSHSQNTQSHGDLIGYP